MSKYSTIGAEPTDVQIFKHWRQADRCQRIQPSGTPATYLGWEKFQVECGLRKKGWLNSLLPDGYFVNEGLGKWTYHQHHWYGWPKRIYFSCRGSSYDKEDIRGHKEGGLSACSETWGHYFEVMGITRVYRYRVILFMHPLSIKFVLYHNWAMFPLFPFPSGHGSSQWLQRGSLS